MKYDYLIVGAGLFGAIFAHEAKKAGKKVLVIDRRDHIGGNIYTKEEIYRMKIESHDLEFMVCINSRDLLGEPQPGRRFKGQIWMQGTLNLVPYKAGPMDQKR